MNGNLSHPTRKLAFKTKRCGTVKGTVCDFWQCLPLKKKGKKQTNKNLQEDYGNCCLYCWKPSQVTSCPTQRGNVKTGCKSLSNLECKCAKGDKKYAYPGHTRCLKKKSRPFWTGISFNTTETRMLHDCIQDLIYYICYYPYITCRSYRNVNFNLKQQSVGFLVWNVRFIIVFMICWIVTGRMANMPSTQHPLLAWHRTK